MIPNPEDIKAIKEYRQELRERGKLSYSLKRFSDIPLFEMFSSHYPNFPEDAEENNNIYIKLGNENAKGNAWSESKGLIWLNTHSPGEFRVYEEI